MVVWCAIVLFCVCVYAKDGTQNVWLKVLRIKICQKVFEYRPKKRMLNSFAVSLLSSDSFLVNVNTNLQT